MKRRQRVARGSALLVLGLLALGAPGVGAASGPTEAQLDEGLLTTADLLATFEETDRRPLDAAELAADDRGPCRGPNTMAHAVDIDPGVEVVTASFGTDAGASLTEDVFSFATATQASDFVARNAKQIKSCTSWDGLLQGATRAFTVRAARSTRHGDQAAQLDVDIAPVTGTSTGIDGPLTRQSIFLRDGSLVAVLQYLRSVDFPARTPGSRYPGSAVKHLRSVP